METNRLASLDQFRGYTVLGMLLVNFVGSYPSMPGTLGHHHVYCSYADTIMPGFLFCVGMAMRITMTKRVMVEGRKIAYLRAIKRCLALVFIGCVIYHFTGGFKTWKEVQEAELWPWLLSTLKRGPFEALTHIGLASLFVLPVITANKWWLVLYAILAAVLHRTLSLNGYFVWNMTAPVGIDGGPLGFVSWSLPLLVGAFVADIVNHTRAMALQIAISVICIGIGYGMMDMKNDAAPLIHPDNIPDLKTRMTYWTMSQRAGSISYTIFGAGFACLVYTGFRLVCDQCQLQWSYLALLGKHALVVYVAHGLVMDCVKPFVPRDAPWWFVLAGFAINLGMITLIVRYFDRNRMAVRL